MRQRRAELSFAPAAGAALALLLLVLVSFWPVVAGRRSFFHMDLYYEHLPVWAATQRALLSGESPFWLEGEYCGQPPLFHQEAPLFYPLTIPLLRTGAPVHRLADAFTLFHFWLAGLAVFLLVRERTGRWAAGLFGGTAWMLSARMVQSALWPNAVAVSALVPLVLYGLALIARGRRRAGVVCAAVSGGLALLGARPHVLLAAAPLVAAFAAAMVWKSASRRRTLLDFALAGCLALALGAPSWLPTAILLPETSRSAGLPSDAPDFQPLAHGHELDMVFLPVDGGRRWPESAAYAGAIVCALALSGAYVFARRRAPFERAAFLACALGGVAGLVLAFGDAGPYRYLSRLPIIRGFRIPERFLLSWSLALAIAAALALAHWLGRARRPGVLAAACLAALAGDLVWHARRAAPTAPVAVYETEPAIVGELRRNLPPDALGFPRRYLSLADTIYPLLYPDADRLVMLRHFEPAKFAVGMRYGLEAVNGYGPTLRRTDELIAAWTPRANLLAGVGAVVASAPRLAGDPPGQARWLSIEQFPGLPRAILVPRAVVAAPQDAIRVALSPALDPRTTAVLEEGPPLDPDPAWNDAGASVRLLGRGPARVALEARLPAAGILVLFDTWESGWHASVDGAAAPVLRADGAFRGVRLAAGAHRVEFTYVTPGLREGLGIGLAGVLGLLLAALRLRPSGESAAGLAPPPF